MQCAHCDRVISNEAFAALDACKCGAPMPGKELHEPPFAAGFRAPMLGKELPEPEPTEPEPVELVEPEPTEPEPVKLVEPERASKRRR